MGSIQNKIKGMNLLCSSCSQGEERLNDKIDDIMRKQESEVIQNSNQPKIVVQAQQSDKVQNQLQNSQPINFSISQKENQSINKYEQKTCVIQLENQQCSPLIKTQEDYSASEKSAQLNINPSMFARRNSLSVNQKYNMIKMLGQGSYGSVWLAENVQTHDYRAIKIIDKTNKCYQQFLEQKILADLDHPNVLKLYEIFEDDKKIHLVTEYLTGGELFDRIIKKKSFSELEARDIMKQILSAVAYCHSKGIAHRDLKPENIMFESPPPCNTLKIIDFGTSTIRQKNKRMQTLQGTIIYLAPEVLSGNYNQKCDI